MIKRMVNYIKNDSFQFRYFNNSLHIINYQEIKNIQDTIISFIDKNNHSIIVKGENIVLKKMISNEALISGKIKSIEM